MLSGLLPARNSFRFIVYHHQTVLQLIISNGAKSIPFKLPQGHKTLVCSLYDSTRMLVGFVSRQFAAWKMIHQRWLVVAMAVVVVRRQRRRHRQSFCTQLLGDIKYKTATKADFFICTQAHIRRHEHWTHQWITSTTAIAIAIKQQKRK